MIIDERGCNLTSTPTIIDGRGEHLSKIFDNDYREMCQIHETVVKKQLLGNLHSGPRLSRLSRGSGVMKCSSDPPSTRAGGQDDVSFTNSLKLY